MEERNALVVDHLRLAWYWAGRARRSNSALYRLPREDTDSAAILGLVVASRRFDPSNGARFGTYATWWIRRTLQEYQREVISAVVVPRGHNRIDEMGRLRDLVRRTQPIDVRHEVASRDRSVQEADARDEVAYVLRILDVRTRAVLLRHLGEGWTYEEVAAELGITWQRVHQVVTRGLARIRNHFRRARVKGEEYP